MTGNKLPDVANSTKANEPARLSWVGMRGIVMPLYIVDKDSSVGVQEVRSIIDCSVDLNDPNRRGIHMSRMYISLNELSKLPKVDYKALKQLSHDLVEAQDGSSTSSLTSFAFNLCTQRESLLSNYQGWSDYPIKVTLQNIKGKIKLQIDFQITYSSTCPCSAALARQLTSEKFTKHFKDNPLDANSGSKWLLEEEKLIATPHSQRSIATISIVAELKDALPIIEMINYAEKAIKTVVQTVVKREDEQMFARLNGENLMFCEDAARVLLDGFNKYPKEGIAIKVCHLESLHAHDAVAEVSQGEIITKPVFSDS